jgi:hypothetical protein
MTPQVYPLCFYRGDTARWTFTLWNDNARTDPHDLTGATVKAEIRVRPSGTVLAALALTVRLPNMIDGLLAASASALIPYPAAWDLQVTYTDGSVHTVLRGGVAALPDVTDSSPPVVNPLAAQVLA